MGATSCGVFSKGPPTSEILDGEAMILHCCISRESLAARKVLSKIHPSAMDPISPSGVAIVIA